jgi:dUTP pyrophosphatase
MIYFSLSDPKGTPPAKATEQSAGWDLYQQETVVIHTGEKLVLDLGVALILPEGVAGLLLPRSWVAESHKLAVHPGVVGKQGRCACAFTVSVLKM